jgi:hypothetical protein
MTRKGSFKNIKLGKNVYRQMKRRGPPDITPSKKQTKQQAQPLPAKAGRFLSD